jgi:uncharacterized protein (DUF58 family)
MSEFDMPTDEPQTDPAEAFEQMRRQLALLTAAVEGFASRQQAVEARDYAPDLGRLIERQDRVRDAIMMLAERPAVALTPGALAARIADAGKDARHADKQVLQTEAERQRAVAQQLETIVGQARSRQQQTDALIWTFLAGIIATILMMVASASMRG